MLCFRLPALFVCTLIALCVPGAAAAQVENPSTSVQTTWRLLDYVAVDYRGAVREGRVVNEAEYAEMREFARTARTNIEALPAEKAKQRLIGEAGNLEQSIAAKRPPDQVNAAAKSLAANLLATYPVPLSPSAPPDLNRGRALYAAQCAACHGGTGAADGPAARGLDPPPIAFTDRRRADERSIFALYQVVTQGLEGTGMASFAHLPEEDRWALALYAGNLAYTDAQRSAGERLWRQDEQVRKLVPNLEALVRITPAGLAERIGPERAELITAYLRGTPSAVMEESGGSLNLARTRLKESVAAFARGQHDAAKRLALSAYLDGFEPVEGLLSARNASLMTRIEGAMAELRSRIDRGEPVSSVTEQAKLLDELFTQAEAAIAPDEVSDASNFAGAFTILLREGLEALLIVIAMIAFLQKAKRRDVLPYVHGGWIVALLAGLGTWWAATSLIAISGASRELMEGLGSLFAAVVLLSVGIWMHGKSNAQVWQRYIKEKLDQALSRQSTWFLFMLAFIVVYREVFETILFFATMWSQGGHGALLAGALAGAVVLAVIGWAMLRYSRKLPITQFFSLSSILIAVLAVVLAGKGVAGLQEAGLMSITPFAGAPRSDLLGLYPTVQTLLAQALAAAIVAVGFLANRRAALALS
jgi:high-affinity iron transporter